MFPDEYDLDVGDEDETGCAKKKTARIWPRQEKCKDTVVTKETEMDL